MLVLEGNGKLLEKTRGEKPVRHGSNILAFLFVDNVIEFLLQVGDVDFHKALALCSGVNNHLGSALLDRGNQMLTVINIFLASDLCEGQYGCVEGHACFFGFGGVFRCSELGR